MDVLLGPKAGAFTYAAPSPIEGSGAAWIAVELLGIEPGVPNSYPSPP
jgi:hypothetical protein